MDFDLMNTRKPPQNAIQDFLESKFPSHSWEFSYPEDHGNVTYFSRIGRMVFFVK
jgi:hypothetical protein